MPTKNGERELRGRSSGDGPVMIAFSNRSQGLTTPSSAGRPMLPALPHKSADLRGPQVSVLGGETARNAVSTGNPRVRQSGIGTKNYQVSTALNYKLKLYEQTTNLQNCCDGCDGPADLPRHRPRANILQRNAYHYHAKPVLSTRRHLSRHSDQDGRDLRCIEEMMD